jgi:hypothetical protein
VYIDTGLTMAVSHALDRPQQTPGRPASTRHNPAVHVGRTRHTRPRPMPTGRRGVEGSKKATHARRGRAPCHQSHRHQRHPIHRPATARDINSAHSSRSLRSNHLPYSSLPPSLNALSPLPFPSLDERAGPRACLHSSSS